MNTFATAIAAAGLAALTALPAFAQEMTLRMGTFATSTSPWAQAMNAFSDIVEDRTEGRIAVEVYTDGQLGDMQQLLTGMQLGTIDMAYFDVTVAAFLKGAEEIKVAIVPYLFATKADAAMVLNSDLFQKIYADIADRTGVRIFAAYGDRSPRAIQTTKGPIETPEDLEGLRMRVAGMDIYEATFETLGTKITSLGMTEIYNALSRGIVDGQDNGFELAIPPKYHEVAKHWSATDHVYGVTGWFISEQVWNRLSDEDKAIFREAGKAAGKVSTDATNALDAQAREILEAAGVTYTEPDRAAFEEALKDVYKQFEGTTWPEGLVAQIRAMQDQN
ncbi:TRAP transporter substrate-binding protein [Acuticoccus sp. M5D2P5]|uniref:TRAP transporter substrate-binding protein n=1 Tax=Acuticoccus kalidii TaxID=2910977 RepID=UPI001F2D51B5|nr:TRAP transporter substrate-binding protein [Acuticoccus kalidii]MCF3933226.1 TRAP transporter substrate-binding protein [Acuticoccus kalidii]